MGGGGGWGRGEWRGKVETTVLEQQQNMIRKQTKNLPSKVPLSKVPGLEG